uniref:Olfactory receptor n=1 Tax=Erpetoichthys calabaricus TaxID=27687 RepID=A0A8C4X696_ERPCA
MDNSSYEPSFILAGYGQIDEMKYFYFSIVFLLYIITISANGVLISIICKEKSLHEPMFIFLCSLAVNGVLGSTALSPSLLVNLISNSHEISKAACLMQIFCLHTYCICELMILAVMGYDRFVSICHPLTYHTIINTSTVYKLSLMLWLFPFVSMAAFTISTAELPLCGKIIEKVYCDNYSVMRLACTDVIIYNIYGLIATFISLTPPLVLIIYSYVKIIKVCLKASKESQAKALTTCSPHLVTLLNFFASMGFEVIQSRFNMKHVPNAALYFLIIPPLLNPVVYGLKMQQIKLRIIKILMDK